MVLRPLILTGGPAAGKTTSGLALAEHRDRAAYVDVDDVRQMVVAGEATLWSGPEGERQLLLAARNASALAKAFLEADFDVVIADFVTPTSLALYRELLADCLVVHLQLSLNVARHRAATRPVYMSGSEFDLLHQMASTPLDVDAVLDVENLSSGQQIAAIRALWSSSASQHRAGSHR